MKHFKHTLPLTLALVAIGLVSFGATAFAAGVVAPSSGSLLDLAKPVYEAIMAGHYIACAALALILAMALVRRYAPSLPKVGTSIGKFLNSDAGNAISTLVISFAGAVATGAAAGVHWGGMSWHLLETSALVGVTAVGGYEVLLHLLAGPVLSKLEAWAEAKWPFLAPVFNLLMGVFNKQSTGLADAKKAGDAAVAANPGQGVAAVIGKPTEIK